jgi:hypothetical protein
MIQKNKLSYHNGTLSKSHYTQDWTIGNQVKVGFLTLKIVDYINNEYILESTKGLRYSFVAHKGLSKIY